MKVRDYQRSWQGLQLTELPSVRQSGPAGPDFYADFYEAATAAEALEWTGRKDWIAQKRNLGARITEVIRNRGVSQGRILSLGVGYGFVEQVMMERGYTVDSQECQPTSLLQLLKRHRQAGAFVCDARSLSVRKACYAAVCMIAVEYAFNAPEYERVFGEISQSLKPGGLAVLVTVSPLQLRDVLLGWPRRLRDRIRHRGKKAVYWGYRRTLDTHIRTAVRTHMQIEEAVGLDANSDFRWQRNGSLNSWMPLFTDAAQVMLIFRKTLPS